jgi:hypothetical protein
MFSTVHVIAVREKVKDVVGSRGSSREAAEAAAIPQDERNGIKVRLPDEDQRPANCQYCQPERW